MLSLLKVDDVELASSSTQLEIYRVYDPAINQAYETGRQKSPLHRLWTVIKISFQPLELKTQP